MLKLFKESGKTRYSLLGKNSLTKYLRYLQKYLYGMKNKANILLNYFFLTGYMSPLAKKPRAMRQLRSTLTQAYKRSSK